MPTTPFVDGDAFDPEAVRAIGQAFDKACLTLGLADRTDPAMTIVAALILENARAGERNPERLCAAVLANLGAVGSSRHASPPAQRRIASHDVEMLEIHAAELTATVHQHLGPVRAAECFRLAEDLMQEVVRAAPPERRGHGRGRRVH